MGSALLHKQLKEIRGKVNRRKYQMMPEIYVPITTVSIEVNLKSLDDVDEALKKIKQIETDNPTFGFEVQIVC